jgi:hypothetical protein
MTFTFALPFTDNSRVRFHTGDTTETTAFLSDELITALITEEGSWQSATIAALQYIIMQLSDPKFTADWLEVDSSEAVKAYERRLLEKRQEFGISQISAEIVYTYRADSGQTEESDYSNGRPGGAGLASQEDESVYWWRFR